MWIPDANLSAEPLCAQRTNWLVHAVRLVARAATKWDAYYEGVNMDEVKRDWAEQVLDWRESHGECDGYSEDEDGEEAEEEKAEKLDLPPPGAWRPAVEGR